ncbi:MAG: MotA/TolQ/ExbB proton channel family protein, partial [Rhizobacter sp.]|nr:MotA/TolQ/ExbB proton channel family protein [Chlorobiales bacterium]
MKQGTFTAVLLVGAFVAAVGIYFFLGTMPKESIFHTVYEGGILVPVLLTLVIMLPAYIIERLIALGKAEGKGGMTAFIRDIQQEVEAGRIDSAIEKCDMHKSSLAAVIRAGLEKYKTIEGRKIDPDKKLAEMQKAIEEATSMEMPLLERNLVAIST